MLYKIINQLVEVPHHHILAKASASTRSSTSKYIHLYPRIDSYKFSFFPRAIRLWNSLSEVFAARCKRDGAYCKALNTGDPVAWQQYRSARNKVNKLLKRDMFICLGSLHLHQGSVANLSHFCYMSHRGP